MSCWCCWGSCASWHLVSVGLTRGCGDCFGLLCFLLAVLSSVGVVRLPLQSYRLRFVSLERHIGGDHEGFTMRVVIVLTELVGAAVGRDDDSRDLENTAI
jgi:hypothetical protein